jgi:hypothetical protein
VQGPERVVLAVLVSLGLVCENGDVASILVDFLECMYFFFVPMQVCF